MGEARQRKLAGDTTPRGTVRREKPEPLTCRNCQAPMAGRGESGICGRCAATAERIATTGSINRRLVNRPARKARRAKKGSKR